MSPGCLSIKIFSLDYYFSLPNDLLDIGYSKFARCYSHRIPVIRVYGTTHTGQKICANVHGVFPYIFIELPNVDSDLDDFVQSFVLSLEKSIRTKLSTPNVKDVIVFDASVVSGFSIYGYHESKKPFIKLYLVDPSLIPVCSDILLSGVVLNRPFQTYESHIPYLLQFCVDYNLFGMNLLYAGYFRFRTSNSVGFPSLVRSSENVWNPQKFGSEYLSPDSIPKCTSMELEVDISAWDILNRRDLQDNLSINPGLEAMWHEEKMRRASKRDISSERLPEMPTSDELLPTKQSGVVDLSTSEMHYLTQWTNLLCDQHTSLEVEQDINYTDSSDPNEYISNWLESSQTDDDNFDPDYDDDDDDDKLGIINKEGSFDEVNNTRLSATVQHTQESIDLKSPINSTLLQPVVKTKSVSSFTTISSAGLEDLCRLANAIEEFDAWVPTSEQLDQLLNNVEYPTEIHSSPNTTNIQHPRLLNNDNEDDWICSPIELDKNKTFDNNVLNNTLTSRNSITHQSSIIGTDKGQEDDKTLILNATQCALSFVCSQQSGVDKPTVGSLCAIKNEVTEDDECMSQPVGSYLDSDDIFCSLNHSNEMFIPSQDLESLREIDEDDEESYDVFHLNSTPLQNKNINEQIFHTQDECTLSDSPIILSPLCRSTENSPQDFTGNIVKSNFQVDSVSDVLFDSWSSESDTSKSGNCIPQVDGNVDTFHTDSDGDNQGSSTSIYSSNTTVVKATSERNRPRKRRRLSLCLLRKPISTTQITNTQSSCTTTSIVSSCSSSSLRLNDSDTSVSTDNVSLDKSTPIINRNQSVFQENLLTGLNNSTSCHSSTVINYSVSNSNNLSNPVVLLERLPSNFEVAETSFQQSGRLTPSEEFSDLEDTMIANSETQTQKMNHSSVVLSEQLPLFSSFHYDFSDIACSPFTSSLYTDKLSLYSQTQLSPFSGMDYRSTIQSEKTSSSSFPCTPFWRPVYPAPRLNVVNNWLKQSKTLQDFKKLEVMKKDFACMDSQSEINHENDKEIKLSNEFLPQCTTVDLISSSIDEKNAIDGYQTLLYSSEHEQSIDATPHSTDHSVSVLYQGANQRCFSSVQVDYTTVASLELHCSSRLIKSQSLSNQNNLNKLTQSNLIKRSLLKCGLIPDPIFDSIQIACLSFLRPQQSYTMESMDNAYHIDLFVLIHSESLNNYTHGLTNFGYGNKKHKLHHIIPRIIWCSTEWNLISWIVYLVQTFDPEILIGYDIERFSWGYLVERANHLGRRTFTRELSRLASDIINCPHCHQCIDKCIKIIQTPLTTSSLTAATMNSNIVTERNSPWHFNTQEFVSDLNDLCNCPCNPLYSTTITNKQSDHANNTNINYRLIWPCDSSAGRTGGPFACPGRVVLCFWRILMHEISLYEYSVETVVYHLLREFMPRYTFAQLNEWYINMNGANRWRTIDYWIRRSIVNLRLLNTLDLIGRTSEFARIFGIEFYHVLSHGSQYRVESLLCRIARQSNFILPSPSVTQRAHQLAPEGIPLNLEPESVFFIDGPIAVLDFQSLYPSVIIAYNYCYSTLLGRLSCLLEGEEVSFNLGCLSHSLPSGLIKRIGREVNISPNGVVFVKKSIREGILPRMLKQLITTRLMVKDSIKLYKTNKCLNRLLDARQLGLKLMANVIFGYTAASFSGRMPCVDLGDSIVHKAREILENAIELVNSGKIVLPDTCNGLPTPRVVYGDTDSLFVHLKGYGKSEAFDAAYQIAKEVTSMNPVPIKLKLEKIYYPCLLEAKKRYVGYAYETVEQIEPIFDAKGIETVRRDSCPFVGHVLEEYFKFLFNHFTIPKCLNNVERDLYKDNVNQPYEHLDKTLKLAEYNMRNKIQYFAYQLIHGRIPFHKCIISRPYWGLSSYKPGTFAPALQVAKRLLSMDPRGEPLRGERVVYYVAAGRSGQTLLSCVRSIHEIYPSLWITGKSTLSRRVLGPRLNYAYYLDKQFIPPIERMTQVIGWRVRTWLSELPRYLTSRHHRYILTSEPSHIYPSRPQHQFTNLGSPSSSFILSPNSSQLNLISQNQRKPPYRPSSFMRAFVGQPPQICPSCESLIPNTSFTDQLGHCRTCTDGNSRLMNIGTIKLGCNINHVQSSLNRLETICSYCIIHRGMSCDPVWLCNNFFCPINSQRLIASADLALFWTHYNRCLKQMDTVHSW
uniref:DNA polymerase zeta catalytic subunit n=1 Tax=Schistosoma mansoni TaxID=6183 RepID=A0A5K4FAI1_SCHMA